MQRKLQIQGFGKDPALLEGDERATFMTWNSFALVCELVESMDETGWKPWATSRHMNREAFIAEMVDLLHFVGNLILCAAPVYDSGYVDVPRLAGEVWRAYEAKHEVNLKRQEDGYDGVSGKCQLCHRELDSRGLCPLHDA
jgi:hypothetical protein